MWFPFKQSFPLYVARIKAGKQTCIEADKQSVIQASRHIYIQADKQPVIGASGKTDIQAGKQALFILWEAGIVRLI